MGIVLAGRRAGHGRRQNLVRDDLWPMTLALVQDRRDIEVKGGRQRIEFQDVSAQIRPENPRRSRRGDNQHRRTEF